MTSSSASPRDGRRRSRRDGAAAPQRARHRALDAELLQTIPGIGPQTAATLLGELGALTRFTDARALVAYVGFYPVITESGDRVARPACRASARALPAMRSTSPPSMPCAGVASGAPFISARRPRGKRPSKRWSWSPSSCFMRVRHAQAPATLQLPHVSSSRRRRLGLDISWDVSWEKITDDRIPKFAMLRVCPAHEATATSREVRINGAAAPDGKRASRHGSTSPESTGRGPPPARSPWEKNMGLGLRA